MSGSLPRRSAACPTLGHSPTALCLAFLLAAAALLAAAEPAAAQQYTTGTVSSPLFLGKGNLNGATVRVRSSSTAGVFTGGATDLQFWSTSGAPSGATVTISSVSATSNTRIADVTLGYTGDFTEDFTLTIQGDFSAYNNADDPERYTIRVLANGTRRLVVGSVTAVAGSGTSATEAGGQVTFPVSLGTPILGAVSVSVSSQDTTEGTALPSSLTFSTSNWKTAQTVTVTGVNDDVDDGTVTWQVRLDPASSGDSGYNGLANVDVDVTTTDDDTAAITVTPTTSTTSRLRTSEDGSTATFTVELDSEPTGNVVLDVMSLDTAQGTVDTDSATSGLQSTLTFTTSNWDTRQTVTLTGVDDSPGTADGSQTYDVTLGVNQTSTADTNYDMLSDITVYAVNADDEFGLNVGSVTGQATEAGGQSTFPVALQTQPTAAVTVAVSSLDTGEGRVSPSSMTFSTSNWNTNQTVTVTGEDDAVHDGTVTWQVRLDPASGGSGGDSNYHGLANVDVDVTTTDDDTLTAALSLSPTSIDESGASNTAAVSAVLSRPSSSATTLTVTAVSGAFTVPSGASGRIVIAANATTSTGTVTITAVNNDTDAPNRTETVTATAVNDTGSGVASVTGATLTITDDDDPPDVTLSLSAASIAENGGTSTVSATLSRPSSEATTVTVTGVSGSYTVPSTPADRRIEIAAGATTSMDRVTITAVDDDVDSPNRTTTVTATMANDQGTGSVTGVPLTLTDDESTPTVTLSASPASIPENGGTSAISATLSGKSSEVTTVTVTAAMGAAYTVPSAPADRRILIAAGATTNESTATVTVTAVNNDVDAADNAVTVTGTAANGHGVGAVTGASLTITDDDMAGYAISPATLTSSRLRTTEAGGTATFTVALRSEPTGNVVLDVESLDTAQGTVSPARLTFTTSTWGTAQTVTLIGVDDNPGTTDGSQTYTVRVGSNLGMTQDSRYNSLSAVTVYAINADDELGLSVGSVTGQATEAGGTATFTVALLTQPTAAVTVAVSSRDASEGRVSPSSLTFSTSNWNTNQTVTVTGENDDVDDGDVGWAVRLNPASGDSDYNGLANVDVAVTTTDDDTAAITVSPMPSSTSRLQTTEAGGTATFTVRLATEPTGDVVLDVASTTTAEGTVLPSALTFTGGTTGTWNAVQTVTLTGVNDAVDDGDQNYTATLTVDPANTADSTYDGVSGVTVYATNADDDDAGLAVSPSTSTTSRLRTREDGSQTTFTVTLTTQPTGAVVLNVASTDLAQGTVSPSSLTFAAADWNTAQTVTLTGVDDDDPVTNPGGTPDGSQDYTVTLTVDQTNTLDSNYDGLSPVTVYAVNADDELGMEVSPVSGGPVTEAGGQATFTVRLITAPSAPVQVAVSSLDPTEGAVAPATLTFTTGNWNTAQAVTVTGVNDDVDDGDVAWKVRLDPSSPGPGGDADYDRLASEEVDVTTTDDDGLPTVMLALSSTAVTEAGGVATVTATLSGKSSEAVTVTVATTAVAPAGEADFTRSPANTLTIAVGTTTSTGLVTVTARDNAIDAPDKQITVSATATGGHGVENPPDVTLTLTDDDTAGLLLAPTALALEERTTDPQATATYTVRLATEPTGAVTVTVTNEAGENSKADVVTVAPSTLTFTMADWDTAQPVTVTTVAEPETNYRHDKVHLTHAVTVANSADSNYASLPADKRVVEVTVTDTTPLPELEAGEDTTFNGHTVRVTATQADAAAGVVVTPPANLNGALTVEISPGTTAPTAHASDATEGTAGRRQFSLGTGAARTVVDIKVTGTGAGLATVQADGLRICLPVRNELRDEAGNRALRLLYRPDGGEWTVVPPDRVTVERDARRDRLCVTETDFSEFAVAYQDAQPRFAADDRELGLKTYLTGREVNEELPGVTAAGDGEHTYTLTPDLPAGLEHKRETGARHGGTITGTPTTPMAPKPYTLTVEDGDGDTDSITFSIEVKPGIESRDLGLVLAGIGRTLATDAVEILGGRFGSTPASRPQITLGGQVLRLTEGGRGASGEGRVESGEGRPQGGAAPATGLSPSSPPPSPLAGEGRGEGAQGSGEWRVKSGGESGSPKVNPKAAGSSSWQQATGLALNVARALGINLNLPSSNSSPSNNSPSPLAGEGRGEGALLRGEGSLLQGQGAFLQGDARRPTALNRGTTTNLLRLQPVSAKDLLARSAFELPLTRTGDTGVPAWTLWGRGSAAGFAGQPEDGFKMDGTLYSGYLGVDYRHASLLMGLAVAHSTGEVSYERTGATKAGADVKLTSVLPYVHWQPSAGLGVWTLLGAGWGEMDLKLAGDSQTRSTRLNSWLGAVGGRQALTTWQGIDLAAKTDAFLTTVRAAGTDEVPEAQGHAQRVRLLVEGRTAVAFSQVSRLEPRVELGARWDSGTAEQGLGAELGGGMAYTLTDWGLSIDAQGRYLLLHEDGGFDDWGASVNVRLDPGAAGQGAYLTLTPVWGQASSGVDQLWSPATALSQASGSTRPATGWRPGRLEVDLGYGLALSDGQFLTPYGGLALAGPGSSRYRLGSRLALSSSLAVNIEAEQAEQPGQPTAHGVSIRLGWQW